MNESECDMGSDRRENGQDDEEDKYGNERRMQVGEFLEMNDDSTDK